MYFWWFLVETTRSTRSTTNLPAEKRQEIEVCFFISLFLINDFLENTIVDVCRFGQGNGVAERLGKSSFCKIKVLMMGMVYAKACTILWF